MDNLGMLAWLIGMGSVIVSLLVLTLLSQRLGEVLSQPKHYRTLIAAIGLVLMATLFRLAFPTQQSQLLFAIAMTVGLVIALRIVWRYWGWLLRER
jgi:hypothetical protein